MTIFFFKRDCFLAETDDFQKSMIFTSLIVHFCLFLFRDIISIISNSAQTWSKIIKVFDVDLRAGVDEVTLNQRPRGSVIYYPYYSMKNYWCLKDVSFIHKLMAMYFDAIPRNRDRKSVV